MNIIKALSQNTNETKLQYKTTEPSNKITLQGNSFQPRRNVSAPLFGYQNHLLKKKTKSVVSF